MKVWWNPTTWGSKERRFIVTTAICVAAIAMECLERYPSEDVQKVARELREAVRSAKSLVG